MLVAVAGVEALNSWLTSLLMFGWFILVLNEMGALRCESWITTLALPHGMSCSIRLARRMTSLTNCTPAFMYRCEQFWPHPRDILALKHLNHNPHYQCSHWTDLSQQMWVTLPVLLSLLHFRPHQFPLQFHFHLNNLLSIPDLLHYLQLYLPDLVYCLSTSLLSSSLCKTFVHMILVHSPFWSYNVIILCGITTACVGVVRLHQWSDNGFSCTRVWN